VAPGTGAGGFGVRLTFPHLDATGEVVVLSATNGDRWDENGGVRSQIRTGLGPRYSLITGQLTGHLEKFAL
jgi:hypothetical protein